MALLIASNVVYQICAKGVPKEINPFVLGIVIVGLEAGWIYAYKAVCLVGLVLINLK